MKKRHKIHRSTLKKLKDRPDLPTVGFEMDWLFFSGGAPRGRWKWGNPRRLYGVKTEQEIKAEQAEKESRKEIKWESILRPTPTSDIIT